VGKDYYRAINSEKIQIGMFKVTGGAHFTVSWPGRATQGKVGRRERRKGKGSREKEDAGREWRMRKDWLIQNEHGQEREIFKFDPYRFNLFSI
jgi:hypothetical protein